MHTHTDGQIKQPCESRGESQEEEGVKKRKRQEEMGGLGRCALYAAGARR